MVRGETADDDVLFFFANKAQVRKAPHIDDNRGGGETKLHERYEAVPSREDLGVGSMPAQQLQGLVERLGHNIIEL